MIINFTYSFRNYGIKNIDNQAEMLAEVIKSSLTTQMETGFINHKDIFLDQLEDLNNIDKIWLSKGHKVIEKYGLKANENLLIDEIDKEVLKTGITKRVIYENLFSDSTYRITIPYKASSNGTINCMRCHDNAKEGDILGAISIVIPVNESKETGISMILNTSIITLVLIILIGYLINKLIYPFLILFDSIRKVMSKAQKGDYSYRVITINDKEAKDISQWINTLLEKLESTLKNIDSKISIFLTDGRKTKKDPLINVQLTVNRLANIYKFRKSIENDNTLEDIYQRIIVIFQKDLKINDFNIIESNKIKETSKLIYVSNTVHCDIENNTCRADKTFSKVDSFEGINHLCKACKTKNLNYICIPHTISEEFTLIISIYPKDKEEASKIRKNIACINDYIDAAKSVIITKKLMNILEKNAKTDQLTGLNNRKYLEEQIPKIKAQVNRSNISYGVLLIDIDYFKKVNDTYGHDVGDETLKVISKTLVDNTRFSDIVVRYGGEEFIVLLYNCNEKYLFEVSEKIRIAFEEKVITEKDFKIKKTVSIGASIFPQMSKDLNTCIKYSDLALYEAKNTGRNKVVLFTKELLNKNLTE